MARKAWLWDAKLACHVTVRTESKVRKREGEGELEGCRDTRKAKAGSPRWRALVLEDTLWKVLQGQ